MEQTILRHQFFRGAFFCYLPLRENYDLVCGFYSTHSVCNDQDGFAGKQPGKRFLYLGFILHVKTGSSLVKEENGSVF